MAALWGSGLFLENSNDPFTIPLKLHSIGTVCTKPPGIKASFYAFALPSTEAGLQGILRRGSNDSVLYNGSACTDFPS